MFAALRIGLLSAFFMSSSELPDIGGRWAGEDWGTVVLQPKVPGEYTGTYSDVEGATPGKIELKWSESERRFNGTWREAEDRFGELSLRMLGDEVHGAYSTDPKSKIDRARPQLAEVVWVRGSRGRSRRARRSSVSRLHRSI